jgi:succinate dehydrogenase/fumarate reductase flavoprotein subunit
MFAWGGITAMSSWDMAVFAGRIQDDVRTLGPGLMAYFIKAAVIDRGIPAYVSSPVEALLRDESGRVVGVATTGAGTAQRIRAHRGVLLATGGYDWNTTMVRAFEHVDEYRTLCPPGIDGDNLVLGGEVGAAMTGVPPFNLTKQLGYHIPGEKVEDRDFWRFCSMEAGLPHTIVVNREGRRFCDESFYRAHQPRIHEWDGIEQRYRNAPMYLVLDQSYRDRYPFGTTPPGEPLPNGLFESSQTLEGLASALGIDSDGFCTTVARWNEMCVDGIDHDFGRGSMVFANFLTGDPKAKPNPNMGPLDNPPYCGLKLTPVGAGTNAVGLRFNADAQVIGARGAPIPGLYVAGNAGALLDLGAGYQSGLANTRGMTWGYIAANHAAS